MNLNEWATLTTALVIFLGAVGGWIKWMRPSVALVKHFFSRLSEVINGRPAEVDAYGRERAPAVPPLVEQQAAVQKQIGELTAVVRELVSHREEIESVKADVVTLKADVRDLKAQRLERIASHIDSAAGWRAVEALAPNGTPDDELPSK